MRPLILLCLALAACAADPVLLPDAGPCSSACGAGTTCVAGACVAIDAGGADVPVVDVGEDRPALPDAGPQDAGADVLAAADAAEDRPAPMDVADAPQTDVGVEAGAADVPGDDGIFRWDRTAPQDDAGRLLCGASHGQACTTNADCARCIPGIWCCAGDGPGLMTCTGSSVFCVGP